MTTITDKDLDFCQGRDTWEKLLIKELKLEEVGQKSIKKHFDLGKWSTLSLSGTEEVSLPSTSWKKSAQTYIRPFLALRDSLDEDIKNGVRIFFFHKKGFTPEIMAPILTQLAQYDFSNEFTVFLLGQETYDYKAQGIELIDENLIAVGRSAHDQGASTVHELGLMGYCLTLKLEKGFNEFFQAVFVDSRFFNNVAKIRAAKLIAFKILEVAGINAPVKLITLNSYRDWTLFERYSNMLRNSTQVASSLIGGADFTQTSGYQSLFELEDAPFDFEHNERSLRMGRNTSHILGLESMLGVVDDAAFGSFHIESLTQEYAKKGWEFMQELINSSSVKEKILEVASIARAERDKNIHTRKHVLAGLNDFADAKEKLNLQNLNSNLYRSTKSFEELRLKVEHLKKAPSVHIAVFGDYAVLNPRLNFAKNFFEVLGLEVSDSLIGITNVSEFESHLNSRKEDIVVYCSQDSDYESLSSIKTSKMTYLAGKVEMAGCRNIYAGLDIYSELKTIVEKWS